MGYKRSNPAAITLFSDVGERKYLDAAEQKRFYQALDVLENPKDRSFCQYIYLTGVRPSEALNAQFQDINVDESYVIVRSLKKRGGEKGRHFRVVPIPRWFANELDKIHRIRETQTQDENAVQRHLWPMGRTTGWERMNRVMKAANISGAKACARGLRHTFGVNAAMTMISDLLIKSWMGHVDLQTTAIYTALGPGADRAIAERMWARMPVADSENKVLLERPKDADVSGIELVRLISAYSAILEARPRLEFLNSIEASASHRNNTTVCV